MWCSPPTALRHCGISKRISNNDFVSEKSEKWLVPKGTSNFWIHLASYMTVLEIGYLIQPPSSWGPEGCLLKDRFITWSPLNQSPMHVCLLKIKQIWWDTKGMLLIVRQLRRGRIYSLLLLHLWINNCSTGVWNLRDHMARHISHSDFLWCSHYSPNPEPKGNIRYKLRRCEDTRLRLFQLQQIRIKAVISKVLRNGASLIMNSSVD